MVLISCLFLNANREALIRASSMCALSSQVMTLQDRLERSHVMSTISRTNCFFQSIIFGN
jgi:hypothetical protein